MAPVRTTLDHSQRCARAVQLQTLAACLGAQPDAQAIVAPHISGIAAGRRARRGATITGGTKDEELIEHPASLAAHHDLRPGGTRLQDLHSGSHVVRSKRIVGLTGAFAQTNAVTIRAGDGSIFLCQCYRSHHRHQANDQCRDQQDGKNPFHSKSLHCQCM